MSDAYHGTEEFQLRQFDGITHYVSASVERNSKGFTTAVKATVGLNLANEDSQGEAAGLNRMQHVQNILLSAAQFNVEMRKLIITLGENAATHNEVVEQARADFEKWMAQFTQPVGG